MKKKVKVFNRLFFRKNYPRKKGYFIQTRILPDWIYYTITEDENNKYLTVHSKLHTDREFRVGPKYSLDFTSRDIVKELSEEIRDRFLNE